MFFFHFHSPDGAVDGGGGVPVGVQHIDVHGRGTDGEAAASDLPATDSVAHLFQQ